MTTTTPRPRTHRPAQAAPPTSSLLGQWNSAVTSYYVLIGATALLLVIGLVMVLSSSSVESLDDGDSPYAVFLDQAKYALIGLPLLFGLSRAPARFFQAIAWPALAFADRRSSWPSSRRWAVARAATRTGCACRDSPRSRPRPSSSRSPSGWAPS